MSCEKGNFFYSFFILMTERHEFASPKSTYFCLFVIPVTLSGTLSLEYLFDYTHQTSCIGMFFEKHTEINPGPTRQLWWSSLWHSLVAISQRTPNIGAMGVLNAPLEYYDVFWNLCRWSNYVLHKCSLQLV